MGRDIQAFLFDLNGTMIDDMQYHIHAWDHMLNRELKAGLSLAQVKEQMYGKNTELLERVFGKGHFSQHDMDRLSLEKEKRYQTAFFPELKLINGLSVFLDQSQQHHKAMAIGSAAIPFNIDFVLDNLHIRPYFQAIVSADDVSVSKPDPETYLKAARMLGKEPATCIVFEDAPKGVESALRAGMSCVALTTMHDREDFANYPNILHIVADYTDPALQALF